MGKGIKRLGLILVVLALPGCGLFGDAEEVDVAAAQEQFCSDVQEYVESLEVYGGLFEQEELTVGEVRTAGEDLEPGRQAVTDSAQVFQEAVEADPDSAVDIELVDSESIEAVEDSEAAFADALDVSDNTPVVEAGVRFVSAAYQLQVAWTRLFADAGCIEDEALASQWVSDYVGSLQTDLAAAGFYTGEIDGLYGPMTIDAVEQLQRDAGLPVTGLVDPATRTALGAALARQTSAEVGALQGILTSTGHYDGPIDGIWSSSVERALKDLQTDLGVPATGVVDTATLRAFEQALAETGQPPVTAPVAPTTTPATPTTTTGAPPTTVPPATTVPPTTTAPAPTTTTAPTTTVPPVTGGILDVLAENGQFGQFLAAVDAAGLTETLSGPGPFTIFAPTDEAFAAVTLPADPETLAALVLYHVVEDDLSGFDLQALASVATAQGSELAISVEAGQIVLNGASTVTVSNVIGGNGRSHVVNAVLIPPG
ncbi:MAG: peptidoglycan-binding protein [Acidimicrobiia bacterium]